MYGGLYNPKIRRIADKYGVRTSFNSQKTIGSVLYKFELKVENETVGNWKIKLCIAFPVSFGYVGHLRFF